MPNDILDIIIQKELFMYKRLLIFTFCVIGLTVLLSFLPIHGETEVYGSVLRLHVLANSDNQEDQSLKLKVRDAVLEGTKDLFSDCKNREQARAAIENNIPLIKEIAENTVCENGYDTRVSVSLIEEEYPTRNYESCCFPAGEYLSLKISLGDGDGQNWWCVLFPPMCLSAATDSSDAFAQVGTTMLLLSHTVSLHNFCKTEWILQT